MLKHATRLAAALFCLCSLPAHAEATAHQLSISKNLFDFTLTAPDGSPFPLDKFRGKVVVLINTATGCGFASQLAGMQELWDAWRDKDVVVISVPSNDYNHQEPRSDEEITRYCADTYHATYPITAITPVRNYDNAHPLYRWIADRNGKSRLPAWNFGKFVFDRNGQLVDSFSSLTKPTSTSLIETIEKALAVPLADDTEIVEEAEKIDKADIKKAEKPDTAAKPAKK